MAKKQQMQKRAQQVRVDHDGQFAFKIDTATALTWMAARQDMSNPSNAGNLIKMLHKGALVTWPFDTSPRRLTSYEGLTPDQWKQLVEAGDQAVIYWNNRQKRR